MKSKLVSLSEAAALVPSGSSLALGGSILRRQPIAFVHELIRQGKKDLTIIGNDTATPDFGIGLLIANRRVRKAIVSHIGTNPETGRQMIAGEIEVELVPQGTLAERIRCGGSGLGGILTPTGVGTVVEEGKTKLNFDGIDYLVERPLRADLAIVKAACADEKGNLVYRLSSRNFNPLVAMAGDFVVAETEKIVKAGEIDPEQVMTPGILVDALILAGEK